MIRWLLARALELPLVVADRLDGARPAAAIVVLGAPLTVAGGLSPVLAERVSGGVMLWQRGVAPMLIVTGGRTRPARPSEAEVMADAAIAAGVPAAAIVIESRARNTAENAREVAQLLAPGAVVWIVTQPFHGRRARRCFRRAGLVPQIWHLADSLQYRDPRRAMSWLVREYAAWTRTVFHAADQRRAAWGCKGR